MSMLLRTESMFRLCTWMKLYIPAVRLDETVPRQDRSYLKTSISQMTVSFISVNGAFSGEPFHIKGRTDANFVVSEREMRYNI